MWGPGGGGGGIHGHTPGRPQSRVQCKGGGRPCPRPTRRMASSLAARTCQLGTGCTTRRPQESTVPAGTPPPWRWWTPQGKHTPRCRPRCRWPPSLLQSRHASPPGRACTHPRCPPSTGPRRRRRQRRLWSRQDRRSPPNRGRCKWTPSALSCYRTSQLRMGLCTDCLWRQFQRRSCKVTADSRVGGGGAANRSHTVTKRKHTKSTPHSTHLPASHGLHGVWPSAPHCPAAHSAACD